MRPGLAARAPNCGQRASSRSLPATCHRKRRCKSPFLTFFSKRQRFVRQPTFAGSGRAPPVFLRSPVTPLLSPHADPMGTWLCGLRGTQRHARTRSTGWRRSGKRFETITPAFPRCLSVRSFEESWERRKGQYRAWLSGEGYTLLVAERDGELLGYALVSVDEGAATWDVGRPTARSRRSRCSSPNAGVASAAP